MTNSLTKELQSVFEGKTINKLQTQYQKELLTVQSKSSGVLANFVDIVYSKSYELFMNIVGDYNYKTKNQFSYAQKMKILDYLKVHNFTAQAQLSQKQKIKFADYDPNYMNKLPDKLQDLRYKILKGRSNLQAAKLSMERHTLSRQSLIIKYLNEQAYEFDRVKYNSIGWGLFFGSIINTTLYKRGNHIRKIAVFLSCGHIFGAISSVGNLNRYFDSVYPIFRHQAVKFTSQQKQQYKGWSPQGKANIEE